MKSMCEADKKSMVPIACEFCRSRENKFVGYHRHEPYFSISKENRYGIYQCNECGLYFTSPRPDSAVLKDFFKAEYYDARFKGSLASILEQFPAYGSPKFFLKLAKYRVKDLLYSVMFQNRLRTGSLVRSYLRRPCEGNKPILVEIGCGSSPMIFLEGEGFKYMGIEPSRDVVGYFQEKGYKNIIFGFGEDLAFIKDSSVDAILFIKTLSHVANLADVLKEAKRVLKTEGIIFMIENNADMNVYDNIGASYAYYGFSKKFLSSRPLGFALEEQIYIDNRNDINPNGSKMAAVLRKKEKA